MIVVDATVIVDYVLDRKSAKDAIREATREDVRRALHAPELIDIEALNALRRMALRGVISTGKAQAAVAELSVARVLRHSHHRLRRRVWELRSQLSAYDASYLALAEQLNADTLITGDAGLAARARASLGERRVVHIS